MKGEPTILGVNLTQQPARVLALVASGLAKSAADVQDAADTQENPETAAELAGCAALLLELAQAVTAAGNIVLERQRRAGTAGLN